MWTNGFDIVDGWEFPITDRMLTYLDVTTTHCYCFSPLTRTALLPESDINQEYCIRYCFLIFFLSSFGTSCGHRCRPFSPLLWLPLIRIYNREYGSAIPLLVDLSFRLSLTHTLALSASQLVHTKQSPRVYAIVHSRGKPNSRTCRLCGSTIY